METVLAIVCPGQGSQTPGLLTPWLEDPGARDLLSGFADAAGTDLLRHGTESDEDTIRDTAVAQPLIAAASLLSAEALGLSPQRIADLGDRIVVSGHSIGEIPAAALAGALSTEQALNLIALRAQAMAQAAHAAPTGMAAVLGGKVDEVFAAVESAGLTAANVNAPGQVVAAGSQESLDRLAENPPARTRVIALNVAGAFHTSYMAPAAKSLAEAAEATQAKDPQVALLSNRDGTSIGAGSEVLSRIVAQVTSPVRWDQCMETMTAMGVTGVLELMPGGTLVGLAKRGLKGVASFALTSPEDLDAAADFITEHTR